jgi:hypothetical protein
MAEFESMQAIVQPCLEMDPASFAAEDLVSIRRGGRLELCCQAALNKDKLTNAAEYATLTEFMAPFRKADVTAFTFAGEFASKVQKLHDVLPAMGEAKEHLVKVTAAWDLDGLRTAMKDVKVLTDDWGSFCEAEVAAALAGVASLERELELVEQLGSAELVGGLGGVPGDVMPPDTSTLKSAVDAATAHSFHTDVGLHRRAQGAWLLRLRAAVAAALQSGLPATNEVWKQATQVLEEGLQEPLSVSESPEFALFREDLVLRAGVEATFILIETANVTLEIEAFDSAIASAEQWKMEAHPKESVRAAQADVIALRARVVACTASLRSAMDSLSESELVAALAECAAIGFGGPGGDGVGVGEKEVAGKALVSEGIDLLEKVRKCELQLAQAIKVMDSSKLEEAISYSKALGYGDVSKPAVAGKEVVASAIALKVRSVIFFVIFRTRIRFSLFSFAYRCELIRVQSPWKRLLHPWLSRLFRLLSMKQQTLGSEAQRTLQALRS